MSVTSTLVELHLFVDDIAAMLALYDTMQLFRSTGDASGPWSEIAGDILPASVTGWSKIEPFALNGKTLDLKFNGVTTVTTSFTGADPYTALAAVGDINTAIGALGLATVTADGRIKVQTTATGTSASIEVTGGTGYASAGFQLNDFGIGVNTWVTLVPAQQDYYFTDYNGDPGYWYRYRFHNTGLGTYSEYSHPIPGDAIRKLPTTNLITATIHLVDLQGNAQRNQQVIVYTSLDPAFVGAYGVLGLDEYITTDEDGFASIALIRGSLVEIAIINTGVRRRIRVPTTGTSFDFLDPSLADDEFGIQYHDIRICERRFP